MTMIKRPENQQDDSSQFPPWNFPTIFADGVSTLSQGAGVVKFYLTRFDAEFVGGAARQNVFAQVVMPTSGFLATFVFFEHVLKQYVESGSIKQEDVDAVRRAWAQASSRP